MPENIEFLNGHIFWSSRIRGGTLSTVDNLQWDTKNAYARAVSRLIEIRNRLVEAQQFKRNTDWWLGL